jgi:Tol biopolymer transport system component
LPRIALSIGGDTSNYAGIGILGQDHTRFCRLTTALPNQFDSIETWLPDGKVMLRRRILNNSTNLGFYVVSTDGSSLEHVEITPHMEVGGIRWSPDGTTIAMNALIANKRGIYLLDANGGELHLLFTSPDGNGFQWFSWSPDSKWILVSLSATVHNSNLILLAADGSAEKVISYSGASATKFAWSPDGQQLALFSSANNSLKLYVMNVDGTNARLVIADQANRLFLNDSVQPPMWLPDGKSLVFVASDTIADQGKYRTYSINIDGSDRKRFYQGPDIITELAIVPWASSR